MSDVVLVVVASLLAIPVVGILGATLIVIPTRVLIALSAFVTFVVVGLIDYYGGIRESYWIPYVLALTIFAKSAISGVLAGRGPVDFTGAPAFIWLLVLFVCVWILSTIVNQPPLGQIIVGAKIYLPMWAITFALSRMEFRTAMFDRVLRAVLLVLLVQVPFVLHQHFIVAPTAGGGFDAVVGTFGGDPQVGGGTSTLGLFLIISVLCALELRRSRSISIGSCVLFIAVALGLLLLGEVKSVLVLLPLAILIQQGPTLIRSGWKTLSFGVGVTAISALVFNVYERLYWATAVSAGDWQTQIKESTSYFFDPSFIIRKYGLVGRVASIALWWNDSETDVAHRLIGYGPGASRILSTVAVGIIGERYAPLDVASTTIAQLLWDLGVLGLAVFAMVAISGVLTARRLIKAYAGDPTMVGSLRTVYAVLVILISFFLYNRSLVDHYPEQFLVALLLGVCSSLNRSLRLRVAAADRSISWLRGSLRSGLTLLERTRSA